MELGVVIQRMPRFVVLGLVCLVVSSCAGTTSSSNPDTTDVAVSDTGYSDASSEVAVVSESQIGDASTELAAIQPTTTTPSSSRFLTAASSGLAPIELVEGQGFNQLVIHSDVAQNEIKSSMLKEPARLVVDLPARIASRPTAKTFETADSEFVSRIRVGSHPDKTRFVIDLPTGMNTVSSDVESRDGLVVVTLAGNANDLIASDFKAAPKEQLFKTESVKSEAIISEAVAGGTAVAATTTAADVSMKPLLQSVRFEEIGPNANQLQVDMESAGFYTLTRTAPSEYVLKLEGASMASGAEQPVVARSGTGKIKSARPTASGNDVALRIFAAPDVALRAESRAGGITVVTTSLGADARAQLAPEGEKKDAAATTTTTAAASESTAAAKAEGGAAPAGNDNDLAALLEGSVYTGRLISLDLQDTDIDNALRIIAEVSNLNIVTTEDVQGKVTLRLIDVPWDQALDVILKINSLGKVQEGNVVRIAPLEKLRAEREALKQVKQSEDALEELKVHYVRISYAKAAELKPLVETVLSERGTVAYDERSNQLIIKDISAGIKRVIELVKKLDLRTPQVLLETQIVESARGFQRDLGARLGYDFSRAPETGNATGWNFPHSIVGSANSNNLGGAAALTSPGFFNVLFGSADGSRSLSMQLAAAENEGIAKVISRPSVATTNNKQATIKSVTKLRVKTPSGGTSVQVGQGGQSGGAPVATETIEAGITLEVTPQASPDYYVLLDINAKSSTFSEALDVDGIPSEIERSATSTILVSSGQTFVMGGIYKIVENHKNNGIPYLKDIPVLGTFFRFSSVNDTDEELLFFITPRIVEGSFDDAAMKASF